MNKNITQSIQKNLYTKVAQKIEEMRKEISASLFEFYTGSHDTGEHEGEVHEDPMEKLVKECNEYVKKHHPEASGDEYTKLMKKCMGHIEESNNSNTETLAKLQSRLDHLKREGPGYEGMAAWEGEIQELKNKINKIKLKESTLPAPVIARRIAGGMDPKEAKTKKIGFKGKHPGKG